MSLWRRPLTDHVVLTVMNGIDSYWSQPPASTAGGLLALYAVEEGSGQLLHDATHQRAVGHVVGPALWTTDFPSVGGWRLVSLRDPPPPALPPRWGCAATTGSLLPAT